MLTPTRASVGPVELRYRVAAANDARPSGAACPFIVEPDRAIVCGEAVFAAPEDGGAARTLRLILTPITSSTPTPHRRSASPTTSPRRLDPTT